MYFQEKIRGIKERLEIQERPEKVQVAWPQVQGQNAEPLRKSRSARGKKSGKGNCSAKSSERGKAAEFRDEKMLQSPID